MIKAESHYFDEMHDFVSSLQTISLQLGFQNSVYVNPLPAVH